MSLPLDPNDVLRHLNDLGYKDISEPQLKDFIKDLKRLIRYEEKQQRIQEQLGVVDTKRTRRDSSSSTSSAYSSSGSYLEEEMRKKKPVVSPRRRARSTHHERKEVAKSERRRKVADAAETKDEEEIEYHSRAANFIRRSQASSESEFIAQLNQRPTPPRTRSLDAAAAKRPKSASAIPPKPTTSFIRPPIRGARRPQTLRCDPVRLHQFYESIWRKTRFPEGENKEVRWAVREWMMGEKKKE